MNHQATPNTSSTGSGQGGGQAGQIQHDSRTRYGSAFSQHTIVSTADSSAAGPRTPQGMSTQGHRSKFAKGSTPAAMNTNMDWSTANRATYGGPFILLPNSTMFNGVQPVTSLVAGSMAGQTDQMGPFPSVAPNMNPNFNAMVPGTYPSWPYLVNYNWQDNRQVLWSPGEAQVFTPTENASPMQYYPSPYLDGSPTPGYAFGSMVSQLGSLTLPYQMMKTTNGYIVQDMEALTQQEPAIPRAVPAMWTNPSELTLAKCLENREGITNVYIRGFLPETTDEMLHAYAARFGRIDRCKAIVDLDSGLCKG